MESKAFEQAMILTAVLPEIHILCLNRRSCTWWLSTGHLRAVPRNSFKAKLGRKANCTDNEKSEKHHLWGPKAKFTKAALDWYNWCICYRLTCISPANGLRIMLTEHRCQRPIISAQSLCRNWVINLISQPLTFSDKHTAKLNKRNLKMKNIKVFEVKEKQIEWLYTFCS